MAAQDWNKTLQYEVPAYRSDIEASTALVHMVNDSHGRIKNGDWDGAAAMCGLEAPAQDSGHKWTPSFAFASCPACLRAYVAAGGEGWFLPASNMSKERADAVDAQLQKLKGAHFTNFLIRKDGQDLNEEADWVKNLRKL
jgi:hypothetical protein